MAKRRREIEEDRSTEIGASVGDESTQPEEGRKGGMVMTAGPAYTPAIHTTRTEAASRQEAGRLAHWGAALTAGLGAGGLLLGLELLLASTLNGTSVWAPVRIMASVILGERALEPPLTFDPGITIAGLLVHFLTCAALAMVLAPLLRWFERGPAALMGAAFGLLSYNLVFYAAAMVRPTLVAGRGTSTIVTHLLFGIVLAALYRTLAGPPEAPVAEPPPAQIGPAEWREAG